jgi:hypothetical protein
MRIDGHWLVCRDDLLRPALTGEILAADGSWHEITFLVDTGADTTSLSAEILALLGFEPVTPEGLRVEGVGGAASSGVVTTKLRLMASGGTPVIFPGDFLVFTEPGPLELSYLGRNILNKLSLP